MKYLMVVILLAVSCSCQSIGDVTISEVEIETGSLIPISEGELVEHLNYQLSYSEENEGALWVLYHLTPEYINGPGVRKNNFKEDPTISTGSASLEDYKGSGYDRGHLCPAASMTINQQAMDESFFMSNMSPQHPSLNRGRWKSLETQVRKWVESMDDIYVVSGAIYNEMVEVIGENNVTVPKYYYKVIWDNNDKIIGFILPNEKCPNPLEDYIVPVDSIEFLTGIDFFSIIPNNIENDIEAKVAPESWNL